MDIVCLGELLIDMFPAEIGRRLVEVSAFHPKPGGAPANVAVAATRLGAQSAFIGKVGDDAFGQFLAATLAREQVDIQGMRFDESARTTMAFIAMPDENTAEFVFYRNPGADMLLQADELEETLLQQTKAFHFGSISLIEEPSRSATIEAVRLARQAGALISFDVNYRPSLWSKPERAYDVMMELLPQANVVKVNEVELALLAGSGDLEVGCSTLLQQGPDLCVVTMGPNGSFFKMATGSRQVAAFPVSVVDAVGCGDAFTAGLLCQLVSGGSWRTKLDPAQLSEILRYANAVGARTAQTQGVMPALPTAAQVDEFLRKQST
jgi:sugar/nucleoside kinase (ribokinase family)